MNRRFAFFLTAILVLIAPAIIQAQTLARLAHEATPDIPHSTNPVKNAPPSAHAAALRESALARLAAKALFVDSNLDRARMLSARALAHDPQDAEALFIRMEIAGMQADDARMLEAAIVLCEVGAGAPGDPRVRLAAFRLREAAANTPDFRNAIPRLQALLANSQDPWPDLQEALLSAAMDGAPGLDPYTIARAAGVLTDWRIVGPVGLHPLLDQQPISPNDDLAEISYQNRRVENFAFPDGRIILPDYFSRRGIFYAATGFSSLTTGSWTVQVESAGPVEIYADGQRVLRVDGRGHRAATFDVISGPHRILLKFVGSAASLRISVAKAVEPVPAVLPKKAAPQELTYLLAAQDYAAGDFATAASQVESLAVSGNSVPLQFLLAQAEMKLTPTMSDTTTTWDTVHSSAPDAIAAHPSCRRLKSAIRFYRDRGQLAAARAVQQKLDGCAPESLDYAQSLSDDGNHADAARSLQRLLAAAPLNRAARQMLVRELQLTGDDDAAQQAAAEWLRVAPNAENYHRLAAGSERLDEARTRGLSSTKGFYVPYRRDASAIARETAITSSTADTVVLLDDHVAIDRPDGSVSLYVHTARRALTPQAALQLSDVKLPQGAQPIALRILHADGTTAAFNNSGALSPGDAVDEEYILHYAGDGGIPEHAEAFQFVFGSFDGQVLHARFVVLMPAGRADRGVVIATGEAPRMTARVRNGMLERVWEEGSSQKRAGDDTGLGDAGSAIVRVVEQENGWTEPSSAEHRHRIETIHPGPRPADS